MSDEVKVTITSNDRDLMASFVRQQAALDKQIRKYDELERKTKDVERAAKRAADDAPINKMVGGLSNVATGWISAGAALSAYLQHNQKILQEANQHADILDDIVRKYSIIANIRGLDSDEAKRAILGAAFKTATSKEQAGQAAQELVSAGMDPKEVQSGGLEAFLQVVNAAAANGKEADYGTMAGAMLQYLNSQKIDPTAENMKRYGAQFQRLSKPTKLSFADMPHLAKVSAGLSGMLSPEEQFSTFGTLRNVMEGSEAATSMKGIFENLSTLGAKQDAQPYLKKMGIRPEDIDLLGDRNGQNRENFDTVLGRLQEGLGRVSEAEGREAMKKIFEGSNISPMLVLMRNRKALQENIALQNDMPGFQSDVNFAQSGRTAAQRRLKLKEEMQLSEIADDSELRKLAIRTTLRDQGESEARIGLIGAGFDVARQFGASSAQAQSFVMPLGAQGAIQRSMVNDAVSQSQDPEAFRQREIEALNKNAAAIEDNTKATREANGGAANRAPAPRPAQALGR